MFPAEQTPEWQQQFIDNYWLNLGDTSTLEVVNPLRPRNSYDIENPHVFCLDLMRRPEYFGFTCKWLFGKTLYPFQLAILRELWSRPFPMLIGSRGMGKCVKGDTLVMTSRGIGRIDNLVGYAEPLEKVFYDGLTVMGEDGHKKVEYAWSNGQSITRRVRTKTGFVLEGTLNHPIRVASADGIVWKDMGDVSPDDYVVIDRTPSWFDKTNDLPDDLAYLFGIILATGEYELRGAISVIIKDDKLAEFCSQISLKHFGKSLQKYQGTYQYLLYNTRIWNRLFSQYGFCLNKDVPVSVLSAPRESAAAFVRGLMDAGAVFDRRGKIKFYSASEKLVRTVQFLLTRFGIIARVSRKRQPLLWKLTINGPGVEVFYAEIGFGLDKKRERLVKVLTKKVANTCADTIPFHLVNRHLVQLRLERKKAIGTAREGDVATELPTSDGITYGRLRKILDDSSLASESASFRFLKDIYEKHYYFDTVASVLSSSCLTYDLHVPDGHSFVSNGFISHNSFILAMYAMLRALFQQGSKIVIVGAAFRQAKVVFDYCQELWEHAPVLRDLVGEDRRNGPRRDIDRCNLRMGDSLILAIPLGDGSKIRGQRANIILCDEFASVPKDIFETVVRGFAAVNMNPVDEAIQEARKTAIKELGLWTDAHESLQEAITVTNQTIISGTAYYSFNHFYEYWKRYKAIVESKGDMRALAEAFGGPDKVDPNLNWKDYSVIRVPVQKLPAGFMNAKQIAQAKATIHIGTYYMEYGATFATDSNGFFKRSLIESCVVGNPSHPVELSSCGLVRFSAGLKGQPDRSYVMAIDPASERDNFSIVVLECWSDHRRIVFCWTTTRARFKAKVKRGLVGEQDFYGYAARKIRDIMKVFPCERIAIDSQGGGISVIEVLQDEARLREGEKRILPVIEQGNPRDTDGQSGDHLIEIITFAKADWVRDANHGMRKDFEDKALLFPEFDPAIVALAHEEDKAAGRVKVDSTDLSVEKLYDTLEDCVLEIEELKDELASIVHTQTGTSLRDRWDTPEVKQAGGKKGRLRKDRYSALLMANMIGRTLQRKPAEETYNVTGGFARGMQHDGNKSGVMWSGKGVEGGWWADKWRQEFSDGGGDYGAVVKRGI